MKKLIFCIIATFLACCSFVCNGQPPQDLKKDAVFTTADSLYDAGQQDDAHKLVDDFIALLKVSTNIDYSSISEAHLRKGVFFRLSGENQQSISEYSEALEFAKQVNDSTSIANAYRGLGYSYIILGRFDEGLMAWNNALELDEKFNDEENMAVDLNAMGKIYEMWRQYDKALEFFFKSLDIAQGLNNLDQVTVRMASIASVYKSQQKFDLALDWLQKSLALEIELNNTVRKGYRLDQIGEIYTLMGQYALAEEYLKQALKIFQDNNVYVSESIVLNHLALNSFRSGKIDSAVKTYTQSLEIALRVGFSNMILKNYQELSGLYEQTGNHAKALEYNKLFYSLKDSVYNERAKGQLLEFQVKYETEQKEKELAILNQEKLEQELKLSLANQQKYLMIGLLVVLLIVLGSVYNRFLIKRRSQAQLTSINIKLNELNNTKDKLFSIVAHDFRNSIAGFSSIVETLNRKYDSISSDNIKHYLGELALSANSLKGMLKNLLEWAKSQQNSIVVNNQNVDVSIIVNEAVVQTLPVANHRNIQIINNIKEAQTLAIDQNILTTVLRNLLSNAIKYSKSGGSVELSIKQNNNHIEIDVTDNGIGMSQQEVERLLNSPCYSISKPGVDGEKGSGLGLMLCKELLEKISGKLLLESELGKGSRFTIIIPHLLQNEN